MSTSYFVFLAMYQNYDVTRDITYGKAEAQYYLMESSSTQTYAN
jgi:hypothetical protein